MGPMRVARGEVARGCPNIVLERVGPGNRKGGTVDRWMQGLPPASLVENTEKKKRGDGGRLGAYVGVSERWGGADK